MTHLTKAYPAKFATLDEKEGRVEALVSIFGNVDLVGDRVVKGAFAKSIEKWKNSDDPIPVILSHDWGDPWKHIGVVEDISETEAGLRAVYTLDIDDNPVAKQIYKLMKRRSLKEHSFAYGRDVRERAAKDGANELLELDIIEIGPTLKGANPATELLAVKSMVKAQERAEKNVDDADKGGDQGRSQIGLRRHTGPVPPDEELTTSDSVRADRTMALLQENERVQKALKALILKDTDPKRQTIGDLLDLDDAQRSAIDSRMTYYVEQADGVKTGRTISKKTESDIRSAVEILQSVLSSVEESPEEEKSTSPEDEEPAVETQGNGKAKVSDDVLLDLNRRIIQFQNREV